MTLGERIQKYRKDAGLTQRELSERIGKTFSSVQKYELGLTEPPMSVIEKIAIALKIPVAQLVGWEEVTQQRQESGISIEDIALEFDIPPEILYQWEKSPELVNPEFISKYQQVFQMLEQIKNKNALIAAFDSLNKTGQQEAVKRIEELTEIPKYQKKKDDQ